MTSKPAHGTNCRYQNLHCRCRRCKRAHTEAQRAAQQARAKALRLLAAEFPERFAAIYAEQKAIHGVRTTAGRPPKVDA